MNTTIFKVNGVGKKDFLSTISFVHSLLGPMGVNFHGENDSEYSALIVESVTGIPSMLESQSVNWIIDLGSPVTLNVFLKEDNL